ncbi:MAG: hypothetical protein OEL79_08330 [Chromatiales bacterium]|nr:hypothetical protein [Chromatiales bacterium]
MKKRRPDLIVVLAILLGIGIVVTEISYGSVFANAPDRTATTLSQK